MGHLSILTWIKVHYDKNTFTGLEFSFTIFDQKVRFKFLGKVKITKMSAGFEIMTYKCVVNALKHCATLLGNHFWTEHIYFF